MNIKHLVISGGGPTLIQSLGCIQYLIEEKKLDIENIETIYGTSAGALLGALLCLKFDNETLHDYLIKRPWHNVFSFDVQDILNAYTKKGILDLKTFEKCCKPLFDAKDLSLAITLDEFYRFSKIELHLFTFETNNFVVEDISYITHPKLTLMQALQMSCGLPILVTPVCLDAENKCYTDGGISCNYPLKYCIESGKPPDEILGIKNIFDKNNANIINSQSTLLDFLLHFLFKSICNLSADYSEQIILKHEICCDSTLINISDLNLTISSCEKRIQLYQKGIEETKRFLTTL